MTVAAAWFRSSAVRRGDLMGLAAAFRRADNLIATFFHGGAQSLIAAHRRGAANGERLVKVSPGAVLGEVCDDVAAALENPFRRQESFNTDGTSGVNATRADADLGSCDRE